MCGNPPLFSHSCLNLSCRTEPKQRHSDDKQTVVEGDPGKFMLWIKSVAQHEYAISDDKYWSIDRVRSSRRWRPEGGIHSLSSFVLLLLHPGKH